jgi:hypothetical protein
MPGAVLRMTCRSHHARVNGLAVQCIRIKAETDGQTALWVQIDGKARVPHHDQLPCQIRDGRRLADAAHGIDHSNPMGDRLTPFSRVDRIRSTVYRNPL